MTQPTDEAAVDIVTQMQGASAYASTIIWNEEFAALCQKAADEIVTLRAQLTAATRRVENIDGVSTGKIGMAMFLTDVPGKPVVAVTLEAWDAVKERAEQAERMLAEAVKAWEALPGGMSYAPSTIGVWLSSHMVPAINRIRALIRSAASGEQG